MTKYNNPELHSLLLDLYAMHGTDTKVAALSGVSRVTLWRMQNMSEEGHPDLHEVEWGGVIKPWHEHKLDALDMLVEDVQQRMTRDAGQGQWIPVVHGGEMKWKDDEYAMSLSAKEFEDALDLGIVWHDKKLRVRNPKTNFWERVPLEQYVPPTLDAQAKVLSSFAPETFGDKRKIDLSVSGGLGVTVMGKPLTVPPQVVDVTPTLPAIEYNDAERVYVEQPQPDVAGSIGNSEPEEEPMPEVPFTADPNSPLSEEHQRVLARARSCNPLAAELAARALQKQAAANAPVAAKPVQPPPPSTYRGDDQDDCVPRTPRGMKVI
jgi:hypothetical protein